MTRQHEQLGCSQACLVRCCALHGNKRVARHDSDCVSLWWRGLELLSWPFQYALLFLLKGVSR